MAWKVFNQNGALLVTQSSQYAPSSGPFVLSEFSDELPDSRVLEGTANQITVTDNGAGETIVLSLPQSIATSSNVTFNGLLLSGLTASRAVVTDGTKNLSSSVTTLTELSYLSGATSNIQDQINNIVGSDVSGSGTLNYIPLWTPDGNTLGNSVIQQSAGNIIVGVAGTITTFSGTTASTSKDTGAIVLEGGLGVEDSIYTGASVNAGTTLNVGTNQTFTKELNHTISVSTTTTAATAGGNLTISAAESGTSGLGGSLTLNGGSGGTTGNGGSVTINSGAGGSSSGNSGSITIRSFGETASSTSGAMTFASGGTESANSGTLTIQSGVVSTSGNSGAVTLQSGNSTTSGNSGTVTIRTGTAATGNSGNLTISTSNSSAGAGGDIAITAGNSFGANEGGDIRLTCGSANTGSGTGGDFDFTTGDGTTNSADGTNSGSLSIIIGTPGEATTGTAGSAGQIFISGSGGGVATGVAGVGGVGSEITMASGIGGSTSSVTGGNAGSGGPLTIQSGSGGGIEDTNTGATAGAGGLITILAGNAGNATAGTGNVGGSINITAGNGTKSASGGSIVLTPGISASGSYGQIILSGETKYVSGSPGAGKVIQDSGAGTGIMTWVTPASLNSVANGGTGNTSFTAYSVICAGTTSTGPFQNVSGVGTSGQVLTSNGAAALPTWQSPSGGSLTIGTTSISGGTIGNVLYHGAGNLLQEMTTTGTGTVLALATSPTFVTPLLGTPNSGTLTNCTGLPLTSGVTGILPGANGGTGVANTGFTITIAGNLVTTGAFNTTFAASATGTYTLPSATSTLLANNLGISGGTTLIGDTAASGNLTLRATSSATDGNIIFQSDPTTERARILSTGEFLQGSTSLFSGETFLVQRDQNAVTFIRVYNATSGTAARAGFAVTNAGNTSVVVDSHSALFTTSGIQVQNSGVIRSNNVAGLNIGTTSNTQTSIWSNNTERLKVLAGGPTALRNSLFLPIVSKTTTYTATVSDYAIICDATSAGFTVTLPTAASFFDSPSGGILCIKKIDSTGNVVTVDGNGSETIDGATTQSLDAQWESITIQSNGTTWYIL